MKIVFVLRSVILNGGIERIMTEKANWLSLHGHEVLWITYEQCNQTYSFELNPKVVCKDLDCHYYTVYNYSCLIKLFKSWMMSIRFRKRLRSVVREFGADLVVIPHNIPEYLGAIVSLRNIVPVVYECHSSTVEIAGKMHSWKEKLKYPFHNWMVGKCNLIVTLNHHDASYWKHYCRNVMAIPNPLISYPQFVPDTVKETGRIICAARLDPVKRVDRLIDAFGSLSDRYPLWHVDIYGDGSEKEALLRQIQRLGLQERVVIHQPTKKIYAEYMKSQLLVLSSDSESFSLVLVEAMACGLPVVATDCPYGPLEIIDDGKTGLLSQMNVKDLAEKIEWMITHEKERMEMGLRAHEASARYQLERVMPQWLAAYQSVL